MINKNLHKVIQLPVVLLIAGLVSINMSSCKKDSGGSGGGSNDVEKFEGSWITTNSQLPSQSLRDNYNKMEFTVDADYNYSWKWFRKDGTTTDYTGYVTDEETTETHTSGSIIRIVGVNVTHINGNPTPGGWKGIYSFENTSTLKFNVEPNVSNWPSWPTAAAGLGSGYSGDESIYTFDKN